ncbi:MAG TPA: AEC family transporter [Tepidisphaeraceae bacterium]
MYAWSTIASAITLVFAVIGIGVAVRRLEWLTEEADASLVRLCVRLLLPCLIIGGMGRGQWQTDIVHLALPPLTGFGLATLGIALSGLAAYGLGPLVGLRTTPERRTFALCTGLYNYGFVPIPLVTEVYPGNTTTLSALLLHNVGVEIAMWTVGILVLTGKLGRRWWAGVLNPVLIAIVISIAFRLSNTWQYLPAWTVRTIDILGACAIPLSLLLTGATVSDVWGQADLRRGWRTVTAACVLRMGLLPLTFFLTARLLHTDADLTRVLAIQAAMPAAMFPIVLARHFGGDAVTAVRVVVGTSIVGLVTMPLWLAIGLAL